MNKKNITRADFNFDDEHRILTIRGMDYGYELFEVWGQGGLPVGSLFRILSRDNGLLTIEFIEEVKDG